MGMAKVYFGRYIPKLAERTHQELHDLILSLQGAMESHFINGTEHPLTVGQQFFIHDLMKEKKANGESLLCEDDKCLQCN